MTAEKPRKPRADAERNRAHVLAVAKATFAKKGSASTLEEIARAAGVGIGTLYRHFPTRDDLVVAIYRREIEQLAVAAKELSVRHPPVEAMRAWMHVFIDYMVTKTGMSAALDALAGGTTELYADTTDALTGAMNDLAAHAVATGEVTIDVEPIDLLRAVSSVLKESTSKDALSAAHRLVDVLVAGLHAAPKPRPTRARRAKK
ncbi:MAG TPA: helix-turn-helix domain-containing protein [Polyangiaceae bacterium]